MNNVTDLKKQLNRLVFPILLETLLTFLLGGVDTFMLSQYSDDAVAAVGMDNQILQLVFLLFTIINAAHRCSALSISAQNCRIAL